MDDEIVDKIAAITTEVLLEIARQLVRLNETMEAIKDGKINVNVSGGINTHAY